MGRGFLVGLVWSIILIVVPATLAGLGIWPALMTGMTVGSAVRFGTDMVMTLLSTGNGDGFEQFKSDHVPIAGSMVVIQFGTFALGGAALILHGSLFGAGIVASMLAAWIFVLFYMSLRSSDETDGGDDEDDENVEWRFDAEDV